MAKYNVDLMLAVREQITSHPETHHQGHYGVRVNECHTTHCIAGWAGVLSGARLEWMEHGALGGVDGLEPFEAGRNLLGLSEREAHDLFYEFDEPTALEMLDELIEKGKNQS